MKVYELILLIYTLVVTILSTISIIKEGGWTAWMFDCDDRKNIRRSFGALSVIVLLIVGLITKINWSWLSTNLW